MVYRYFQELKNRLVIILFASLYTIVLCFLYKENLLYLIILPFSKKLLVKYIVFTELSQAFEVYFSIMKFILSHVTCTLLVYHISIFLSPGFTNFEYITLKKVSNNILIYLLFTNYIFYSLIFPTTWQIFGVFIANLSNYLIFYFEPHLIDMFNFFKKSYFSYLFLVGSFLTLSSQLYLENKLPQKIKDYRKFTYTLINFLLIFALPTELVLNLFLLMLFIFYLETKILLKTLLESCSILVRQIIKTN